MKLRTILIICLALILTAGIVLFLVESGNQREPAAAEPAAGGQDAPQETASPPDPSDPTAALTKEYVIANSELTEADFEGVDFDAFVAYFELTPERLEEYDPAMLLGLYKQAMAQEPTVDYSALYAEAEGTLSREELEHVVLLVWELHKGNENRCMVIDRETGAVYYGQGCFLDAVGESMRIADFTEEDAAFLTRALEESGITGWENEYKGSSEGTTGLYEWAVGIRLEDGRCVRYSGSGVRDSGSPETVEPLLNALAEHFQPAKK